jgi:arylsulfatase A
MKTLSIDHSRKAIQAKIMNNCNRRDFFKILPALGFLGNGLLKGCDSVNSDRPNIVLLMADDVGREVLGCYGGTSYHTPNLDALAKKGMRFEHVYSAPVCHPTRLSLLTGKYPFQLGNPEWGTFPEYAERQTFAHQLKHAGYATAVAGKWQLTLLKDDPAHPHRLGFDEYCLFGWHEGPRYHNPYIRQNGQLRKDVQDQYGPDVYSDFLIDFMRKNKDRPFLAYYPMTLCHDVSDDLAQPPPYGPQGRYESVAEMVAELDRVVAKMYSAVETLGLSQKTLFLFTSDNGTNPRSIIRYDGNEYITYDVQSEIHGKTVRGGKKELTDWGTRVPTLALWPGRIPEGSVCDDLIDFTDFLPTINELAGISRPSFNISGYSFAARLTGKSPEPRKWVYSEGRDGELYWVKTKEWKLYSDGRLYYMKNDADETNPFLAEHDTPESQHERKKLMDILKSLRD